MAEVRTRARKRAKETSDQASGVEEKARSARNGAPDSSQDGGDNDRSSVGQTITGELKDTFREAAIEVLKPVMRKATTEAAKLAVKQGPKLVKDKVAPKIADAGGAAGLAKGLSSKGGGVAEAVGGVASKLTGGGKGGKGGKEGKAPSGTGRGRRLPVEETIDIGVDIETAYDQFTQFEDWPKFMHRVERIEQRDESTLMWHENIWGIRRSWEAEIIEQVPCERLVWRSKNGPMSIGIVTFHRISDQLTRIMFTMDFQPQGVFERTASGTRISRRALSSDLMRFKAFVELRDEATGGWRGRIEDGEVVDEEDETSDDQDVEARGEDDEEFEDEEPEASEEDEDDEEFEDEEPEASEEDEDDEEFEDEEPEASEEDEDDEEFEDEEPQASEEDEEEEDRDEPRGRRNGHGRFKRDEADEQDEDEEAEETPRPRRRRRSTSTRTKA